MLHDHGLKCFSPRVMIRAGRVFGRKMTRGIRRVPPIARKTTTVFASTLVGQSEDPLDHFLFLLAHDHESAHRLSKFFVSFLTALLTSL